MKLTKPRKILMLSILGIIPLLVFILLQVYAIDLVLSMVVCVAVALIFAVLYHLFVFNHPFFKIIEGDGLPVFVIDSNGVINIFVAKIKHPELSFFDGFKEIKQLMSRFSTFYIIKPKNIIGVAQDDKVVFELKKDDFKTNYFMIESMPCFIFNYHTGSLLTKDFLNEQEKNLFAEHNALYITRKVEEISQNAKLNADYAMALLSRSSFKLPDWIKWVLLIVVIGIIGYIAYPHIANALGLAGESVVNTATNVGNVVQPIK